MEMEQKETSLTVSTRKGGLRTMPFIIANETFERVASVGLHVNMIIYLMYEYHFESATGASILFLWAAVSNFMPILGAFLSDSYLGRFRVIGLGTIVTLLGMTLLWLTSIFQDVRPPHCDIATQKCAYPKPSQLAILFSSFALMSIGAGGIRPCSLAFGADQLDRPDSPKNERVLQSFFNWYYVSVGVSVIISMTVIVYVQEHKGWIMGFGIPVGLMLTSTILYFLGSPLYVRVKANKSLFVGFYRVIKVASKKKHVVLPPKISDGCYYHDKGVKLIVPSEKIRSLNKACIIMNPAKELNPDGSVIEPWTLCTVQQVEELKALIKVLPIWSTSIIIAVTISQHAFPVLQAKTMVRSLGSSFKMPAASFGIFTILTLTLWVGLYDRIIVPRLSKLTKNPRGLSFKQRMGIGLVLACLATAVSGVVEHKRRATAIGEGLAETPQAVVHMSAMWLVPQYCLYGLAEAFNAIGQIEFYYSQFPKSMSSIAVSLFALGSAVGNLLGSLIVGIMDDFTKRGGKESWVSSNLNKGHYDYYYWVLSILSVVNVFYFLLVSRAYGNCESQKVWDEGKGVGEEMVPKVMDSPIVCPATT